MTCAVSVIGGLITLSVAYFKPLAERKGVELAGDTSAETGKNQVVLVAGTAAVDPAPRPAVVAPVDGKMATSSGAPPSSVLTAVDSTGTVAQAAISRKSDPEPARAPRMIRNELSIPAFGNSAEVEHFPSDGDGRGADRETAICRALEEAMSKQGAVISADVRLKMQSETRKLNDVRIRRVDQSLASDFHRVTDGLVRWWDIRTEDDDGTQVRVQVAAVIAKIRPGSGEHATRKTLAVLPFKCAGEIQVLGRAVGPEVLGMMLRDSTLTYLVQSRKFAIADKTYEQEIDRLAAITPATDPVQRAIQAAVKLGAQYVVVGSVAGFGVSEKVLQPGLSEVAAAGGGTALSLRQASGQASVRVIDVKSRQTLLAAVYAMDDLGGVRLDGPLPEAFVADAVGRTAAGRILETIYPLKVAGLNGPEEVVLNRGGDSLAVGDRLELFNPGEELKDPSTGESLGVAERRVAIVEVVRVLPKVAYAKILEKAEDVAVEAICRRPQSNSRAPENRVKTVTSELENLFK